MKVWRGNMKRDSIKDLTYRLWCNPYGTSVTLTRKELQEFLLAYDGRILACGNMFDIKSKSLGAGVYKVYLEEANRS
jgi:hypothetical protein